MTTGIYSLYWEEQDLIYIGQSQDIESRFKRHIRDLIGNRHTNYKVQNTYNLYHNPKLYIIEKCNISELNNLEVYWTEEFNSINTGLNIVEAGAGVGYGPYNGYSKYSKVTILKVFHYLYNTIISCRGIAEKLNVGIDLPKDISQGKSHLWLKEKYPEKYRLMYLNRDKRYRSNLGRSNNSARKASLEIISPEGIKYSGILNLTEFCRNTAVLNKHVENSRRGLNRILNGSSIQYKGWTIL